MGLRKILISALFFIVLTASLAFSYDNLGTSAKAVGMGNAFVAIADDPSGVFYNPAGLARLKGVQLSVMYDRASIYGYNLDEKPYVGFGSLVYPMSSNKGVLAFSGSRKASWTSQSQIVGHNILSVSYARSLGLMSSFGLNAKMLSNSNVDKKSGFEVDLGFLFPVSDRFSFGIVGENLLGTDMTPDTGVVYASPQTPNLFNFARRVYKAGMALSLPIGNNSTRIAYDVIVKDKKNFTTSTPYLNSLGVEQSLNLLPGSTFFLRAGYTFGKDYNQDYKQWAWGLSYKFLASANSIQIDYSYQSYPFQTPTSLVGDHRLGLTIGFGFAKSQDSFAQNKPSKKSSQTMATKSDKSSTVSKDVKPSTVVEQPLVKKEEPKVSQPTTTPTTPSKPTVTTPPASDTKVATTTKSPTTTTPTTPSTAKSPSTEKVATPTKTPVATTTKPKTTTTPPTSTPSSASKTTTPEKPVSTVKPTTTPTDKSKSTTVTKTTTTSPDTKKSTPSATTPTVQTGKTKAVSVTKAPVSSPDSKVVSKEKPVAATTDKSKTSKVTPTPTSTATTPSTTKPDGKVTPTSKPTGSPLTKTTTSAPETKVTPSAKPTTPEKTATTPKTTTPEKPTVSTPNKSKEITLAQVTPPTSETPTPAVQKPAEVFEPIKVSSKMDKIQTQSVTKKSNSYMFIFKAGLSEEKEAIVDWKVYVCSSMPKGNNWESISPVLIKTLEGRGNLPSGILWEVRPEYASLGTVYYAIQIKTSIGKKYFSTWQTGKLIK